MKETKEKKPKKGRGLKRFLWVVAILVTLTFLFYAVEGWRGARAWAKTEQFLQDEGEILEFSDLRPKPVADADNFFAIPLLASLTDFTFSPETNEVSYLNPEVRDRFLAIRLPDPAEGSRSPEFPGVLEGRRFDQEAWTQYLAGEAGDDKGEGESSFVERIMEALAPSDADFAEIAEAAKSRGEAQLPMELDGNIFEIISAPNPQVLDLMGFAKFLTIKGCAAAAGGDPETAIDCMRVQLKLAEGAGAEPLLINHLVRVVILNNVGAIIREGNFENAWNEEELRWIEDALEETDLFAGATQAMRGEMTGFFLPVVKFLKSARGQEWVALDGAVGGGPSGWRAISLIPDGWLDQNASKGCEILYRRAILPLKKRDLRGFWDNPIEEELTSTTPYNFLVKLMVPASVSVIAKTAQTQAMLDSARVACAMERYRINNGDFPGSLGALVPEFLAEVPIDPITMKPLLYRREGDSYRVYSVGKNGVDDGGTIVRKGSGRVDRDSGDWVWSKETT